VATKTGWDFTDAQKKEIQINKSAEVKQEEEYGESGGRGNQKSKFMEEKNVYSSAVEDKAKKSYGTHLRYVYFF
jgi:hypothetical protein